ncbi:hypothetical protein PP505_gp52 [Gordonia phage Dorito]|uniref:Uncharacterized protein n=1 Tax=Gordonia phage Dorito TaxID=2499023 RepID=A0A3S9UAK5_9CAUD|nr:hypothetical protein PP505_gp52 [Gordonia phage Dorito]AZS07322.1 hypothetical protein PBI_DORITO_52 [Gordonia phage Dorito]
MTGNRYQVRAIHYADGTVDDLDAMRKMNDEAVSLSYWLANELGEHIDHQADETLVDTVKRYALQDHNDLSQLLLEAADVLSAGWPPGTKVGGRGVADAARRLAADREHWKSECEKARARWTSPRSRRERWVGEAAEPIPFPRPYNDLHQIQVDYLRAIECSTSGPTPEERQEKYQQVFDAAMSLVYEVTHLRAQVADLQEELADERVIDAMVVDHHDPEQVRRAAGDPRGHRHGRRGDPPRTAHGDRDVAAGTRDSPRGLAVDPGDSRRAGRARTVRRDRRQT